MIFKLGELSLSKAQQGFASGQSTTWVGRTGIYFDIFDLFQVRFPAGIFFKIGKLLLYIYNISEVKEVVFGTNALKPCKINDHKINDHSSLDKQLNSFFLVA